MSPRCRTRGKRCGEHGYALLLVMFLASLMLLGAMTVGPNLLTQGRREREKEMIWRGEQYVRGIKLFYRKTGRFPSSIEDLVKPKTGIRFLRQAYTDPMNTQDGSWRLIYVGPGGQLLGSVKQRSGGLQFPAPAGAPKAAPGTQPGAQGAPAAGAPKEGSSTAASDARPDSTDFGRQHTLIGGNIIGVGSKVRRPSIIVYENGYKYSDWEFIWDPAKDAAAAGQSGMQTGAPIGQPIGTPPGQPARPGAPPNPPPRNPQ